MRFLEFYKLYGVGLLEGIERVILNKGENKVMVIKYREKFSFFSDIC